MRLRVITGDGGFAFTRNIEPEAGVAGSENRYCFSPSLPFSPSTPFSSTSPSLDELGLRGLVGVREPSLPLDSRAGESGGRDRGEGGG